MQQLTQNAAVPSNEEWTVLQKKLTLMIVVVAINRMLTKIIPVHVFGVINLHKLSSYTALPFPFGRVVNHVFAMIDICLLSAIATSNRFVSGYFLLEAFCTAWYPRFFPVCGQGQSYHINLLAIQHPSYWKKWCKKFPFFNLWQAYHVAKSRIKQTNLIGTPTFFLRWQERAIVFSILSSYSFLENLPAFGWSFLVSTNSIWKIILRCSRQWCGIHYQMGVVCIWYTPN